MQLISLSSDTLNQSFSEVKVSSSVLCVNQSLKTAMLDKLRKKEQPPGKTQIRQSKSILLNPRSLNIACIEANS